MNGFILNFENRVGSKTGRKIMDCFDLGKIPVLTTLANEFALFDKWYASVPGPTTYNRFFFHSASASGGRHKLYHGLPQQTIYDRLTENNLTWQVYYPEWSSLPWFTSFRKPENVVNMKMYSFFRKDAAAGKLPNYTFIEPRYYTQSDQAQAQDQHPSNSVYYGELLIKEIYEILRAGPLWEKTALVITYDEYCVFEPPFGLI